MQELLFSPKTLAAYLGLAEQTIYNRHSSGGDLPKAFKLGRLLRFHADDVNSWLNAKRQFDPSAAPLSDIAHPSYNGRSGEPPRADITSPDF
jgi:excisionase family DNA binding protein